MNNKIAIIIINGIIPLLNLATLSKKQKAKE